MKAPNAKQLGLADLERQVTELQQKYQELNAKLNLEKWSFSIDGSNNLVVNYDGQLVSTLAQKPTTK